MDFYDFFRYLGEDLQVLDTFLPFLLVFVIIFAILEKTKVLGVEKKEIAGTAHDIPKTKLNTLLAAIFGAMVVIPHVMNLYPPNRDIVTIINTALPNMAAILVAVVLTLLMVSMLTGSDHKFVESWIPYVALAIVVYVFGAAADWWGAIFPLTDETISLVLILLIFGLVFWFITKPIKPGDDGDTSTTQG